MHEMDKLHHLNPTAKIYIVGGYVRNRLMGIEATDHDFVVVGATPSQMEEAGFKKVGADFPVYLNFAGDEFALARQERKVGDGYHGFETRFDPSITLEDDLVRRDLTMNAMARLVIGWNELGHAKLDDTIIDPYGGQQDLKQKTIRHVSDAFKEDPVRVLRVARFAAQHGFEIDYSTMKLMMLMVADGELDHLTAERVYLELEKAMDGTYPGRFFRILNLIGAISVIMPKLVDYAEDAGCVADKVSDFRERMAVIAVGMGEERIKQFFNDLKAPADIKTVAIKMERFRIWRAKTKKGLPTAEQYVELFKQMDLIRDPDEFTFCVETFNQIFPIDHLTTVLEAAAAYMSINFEELVSIRGDAATLLKGPEIGQAIAKERLNRIQQVVEGA